MTSTSTKPSTKLSRKPSKRSGTPSASEPEISVVVCSFNGAHRIAELVRALEAQTARDRMELIVVDDGSSDATGAFAELILEASGLRSTVITLSANAGLSAARNAGVEASSGEIIAFTDDDCVPDPRWVESLLEAWSTAPVSVHGIGGPVHAASTDTINRRFLDATTPLRAVESGEMRRSPLRRLRDYLVPRRFEGRRFVDSYVGANMSFRRTSIDAVGGFDPSIRFGGDEQYLCRAFLARFGGSSLHFDPAIPMAHEFHPSLHDTLRRARSYGRGTGRNWARSGGIPTLLPGPFIVLAAAIGPGLAMALLTQSPLVGFLAAAFLTLAFTVLLGVSTLQAQVRASLLERSSYPFLRLAGELADLAGFVQGVFTTRIADRRTGSPRSTGHQHEGEPWYRTRSLPATAWFAAGSLFTVLDTGWPSRLVVVATLILLPGSLLLARIGFTPAAAAARLTAATATGLTIVMGVGVTVSWLGPHLGVDRPLDRAPLLVVWSVIGVLGILTTHRRNDPVRWLVPEMDSVPLRWVVSLAALPAAACLAAARLNNGGSGTPALILTVVLAALIVTTIVRTWSGSKGWPVEAIAGAVALSLVWSTTLRGFGLFGWDIQKELGMGLNTVEAGVWSMSSDTDAYASMLSLTVLPAQLFQLAGIPVGSVLRWVFPVFLAVLTAGLVAACRRRSNPGPALLAVTLFVLGTASFARQIPAIGRQEVAFLLFATIVIALVDDSIPLRARRITAATAGVGMAYAHYTSSYVTSFFIALVMIGAPLLLRRTGRSYPRVLSFGVCVAIIGSSFVWNAVLTRPGTELSEAQATVSATGLRLLDNGESSLLRSWLGGTGARQIPFEEYRTAVIERRDRLDWVRVAPGADTVEIGDAAAPKSDGVVEPLKPMWELGQIVLRQLLTLMVALSLLLYARRFLARHPDANPELLIVAVGAFTVAGVLRLSSTAGTLYNPERAAIHAGMVFCLLLAPLLSRSVKRAVPVIAMSALLMINAWGLSTPAFGGGPLTAFSNTGEDSERYLTTSADHATVDWLDTEIPPRSNVHTDRYGRVLLLSVENGENFTVIDVIDPVGVDRSGYVMFTSMNHETGRARGQIDGLFSVYTSPESFYEETRSIVMSTEVTRVYR